jgi:hypothetical protein
MFLTEDQLNVIKTIIEEGNNLVLHEKTKEDIKWDEICLRPTLESLGLTNKFTEDPDNNFASSEVNVNEKTTSEETTEGI